MPNVSAHPAGTSSLTVSSFIVLPSGEFSGALRSVSSLVAAGAPPSPQGARLHGTSSAVVAVKHSGEDFSGHPHTQSKLTVRGRVGTVDSLPPVASLSAGLAGRSGATALRLDATAIVNVTATIINTPKFLQMGLNPVPVLVASRLVFPDQGSSLVYMAPHASEGESLLSAAGRQVRIYSNQARTMLADLRTLANNPISGSIITVQANSQYPLFLGPDDGTDTLYDEFGNTLYARDDDRLDALATQIVSAQNLASTQLGQHVIDGHPSAVTIEDVQQLIASAISGEADQRVTADAALQLALDALGHPTVFDATQSYSGNAQAAINAAESAGGGLVWLGGPLYAGPLVIPSYVHVGGPGRGTTVRLPNGSPNGTHTIATKNADTTLQHNFGITGITVDGNKANNPNGGDAVHLYGVEAYVDDIACVNAHGRGFYDNGNSDGITDTGTRVGKIGLVRCANNDGDGFFIDTAASDRIIPGPIDVVLNGGNGLTVKGAGCNFGQVHTSVNKNWGAEILGATNSFLLLETDGDNALDAGHSNPSFLGGGLRVGPGGSDTMIGIYYEVTNAWATKCCVSIEDRVQIDELRIQYGKFSHAPSAPVTASDVDAIQVGATGSQAFLRAGLVRIIGNGAGASAAAAAIRRVGPVGNSIIDIGTLDIEGFTGAQGGGMISDSGWPNTRVRGRIFNCTTLLNFGSGTTNDAFFDLDLVPDAGQTDVTGTKPDFSSCKINIHSRNLRDGTLVKGSWDRLLPTNFPVSATGQQVVNWTHKLFWQPDGAEIKAMVITTGGVNAVVAAPVAQITGPNTIQFTIDVLTAGASGQNLQLAAEVGQP